MSTPEEQDDIYAKQLGNLETAYNNGEITLREVNDCLNEMNKNEMNKNYRNVHNGHDHPDDDVTDNLDYHTTHDD